MLSNANYTLGTIDILTFQIEWNQQEINVIT